MCDINDIRTRNLMQLGSMCCYTHGLIKYTLILYINDTVHIIPLILPEILHLIKQICVVIPTHFQDKDTTCSVKLNLATLREKPYLTTTIFYGILHNCFDGCLS